MLQSQRYENRLIIYLSGELDHCAAQALRDEIEQMIAPKGIKELCLDFSEVGFMDSSGVGLIIGRYKTMIARGGSVSAQGLTPATEKMFRLAGLHRIIKILTAEEQKV